MIIGETRSERRNREAQLDDNHRLSERIGQYIDEFTTVEDTRTAREVLARLPKCCVRLPNGHIDLKGK